MSVDFIIPAHNEAPTIRGVVAACRAASELLGQSATSITVIADHCTDDTAEAASSCGAEVVLRSGDRPSKAAAVQAGIVTTGADVVALFDADCIGLDGDHVATVVSPVTAGVADQSVGVLDYGWLSHIVQRYPWSSGQRAIRRDRFEWGDDRLSGYSLEMLINETVGAVRGRTYSAILQGVTQRSKLEKWGMAEGARRDVRMWRSIADVMAGSDREHLAHYFNGVVLSGTDAIRPISRLESRVGEHIARLCISLLKH